jgi:hypothetical protein
VLQRDLQESPEYVLKIIKTAYISLQNKITTFIKLERAFGGMNSDRVPEQL